MQEQISHVEVQETQNHYEENGLDFLNVWQVYEFAGLRLEAQHCDGVHDGLIYQAWAYLPRDAKS